MFARFDENPAMSFQDIKETKRYGRKHRRTDNVKTVYPPQTKFAGCMNILQSLNSTPHYNMGLDITWSCCGSQFFYIFLMTEFYKGIVGK